MLRILIIGDEKRHQAGKQAEKNNKGKYSVHLAPSLRNQVQRSFVFLGELRSLCIEVVHPSTKLNTSPTKPAGMSVSCFFFFGHLGE